MATTKYSVSAYVADGVTTDFLITWDYLDTDHIAVYVDGVSNSDPSSTFQFSQINSTTIRVTDELGDPIASGLDVEIHRETPILNRAVTFIDGSALLAEDLNKNSDYLLFAMQEAIDTVDIAAQNGAEAAQLATETLRDETQVLRNETEGFRDTTLTYRDQTYAYLNSVSADVTTVAGIEADVTTVATNIVAVQNADANATTATTKAAEASASAAAALVSENNSATSATNAATSEANAASSAVSAGSSATSAASSATSASSSASSASSSASVADASAISAAQNEALSAANKDAAGVYAGQAASSASAAAVSAGAAATSESNAADTLTIIEGIYDQFDDRYLGPKATDPTLDNDGNALVQGTMYFSTSENSMKVYDGANWVSATSAGGASLLNYNFTATAGQTTFSGADDNAATLSYTQQNLIVTLNGIVLEDGTDYTASNGTSIVLTTAAAAGDELNIVAFKSFTTADMVPASTGGTFSGSVAVDGNLTVDTDTLFVDSVNKRVGVGTNTPLYDMTVRRDVAGAAVLQVMNTDANVQSGSILQLQSQSAYVNQYTTASDGYFQINGAGGIDKHYSDFDWHMWRNNSGIELMRLNPTGALALGSYSSYGGLLSINRAQSGGYADLLTLRDASSGTLLDFNTFAHPSFGTVNHIDYSGAYLSFRSGGSQDVLTMWNTGQVGIGYPYTGNSSKVTISRDNPSTYNSSHLELVSNAGDVILGLHAGGASAVCMDHVRGGPGFRFVNLVRTAHVPIEASAFNVNSDYRVKENITDLTGASERLKQLPVHRFSFIEGSMMYRDGAIVDGFLAHEVQAVVPEAVTGEKDAMRMESYEITPEERDAEGNIVTEAVYGEREVPDLQSIDQSKLVPLLTAALQEALGRIEILEADVAALKGATNV